jgi:urease accessory protein
MREAPRRVHGVAEISFARRHGATRLVHLYEHDPLRVLFPLPESGEPPQAAIVTTSGGLVAGDRLDVTVRLADGAAAHVTASAAEKIYRSLGATTEIRQSLTVGDGATLEFLPPETILFDGARLRRKTVVALAPKAAFLGGDIVIFGRRARGERFTHGLLHEVWEMERASRLVWGDAVHFDGNIAAIVDDPACFAGAAGFATLILAVPASDLGDLVAGARATQSATSGEGVKGAISIVNGLLIARWLGFDALSMRRSYADLAGHLRAVVFNLSPRLPRLWHV